MYWMLNQSSIASEFIDHLSRMETPWRHNSVQSASGSGIMLRNREAGEPEMKGGFMCFSPCFYLCNSSPWLLLDSTCYNKQREKLLPWILWPSMGQKIPNCSQVGQVCASLWVVSEPISHHNKALSLQDMHKFWVLRTELKEILGLSATCLDHLEFWSPAALPR